MSRSNLNDPTDRESGYLCSDATELYIGSDMRDVEIMRITNTNVIARGRRYGRQWLLKGLREDLRDSAAMRRRLLKEFEIHSRLRHPGVVQAVGLETVDGLGLCIVEEWVEGVTLHEALLKGMLNSTERRRVVRELTQTVAYLHSRGIVHRDLKPSNVMIHDVSGEIILIDFGLADTADYVEIKGPAGTPGFISPEQMENGGANPADDVYSLGVIFRDMLPSYRRLADRCTGPADRRPRDAREVLKLLDARRKRPRIILSFLAVALIALVAALGLHRIHTLGESSRMAADRVSRLSDENKRNAALVSSLKDSLTNLNDRLELTSADLDRLSKTDSLKQSAVKDGCRIVDRCLQQHDRTTFADCVTPDQIQFNENLLRVVQQGEKIIKDHCSSLKAAGLSDEDIESIKSTITTYFADRYSGYHAKWMGRRN